MKVVALMPIKAHSERVPGKNFKSFDGKPLYAVMLEKLLATETIDKVVINTDSHDFIAELNEKYPAVKTHYRPEAIQGDMVSMNKIIAYDMENEDADVYLQTHTTNPILSVESLDKGLQFFISNKDNYDSVFSVTGMQTRLYWENGEPVNHNPNELIRTQDLPMIYEENSCFFIFTKDSFQKSGEKRIGLKPYMFPINKLEAVDIDNPEDFELAEMIYKMQNNELKK